MDVIMNFKEVPEEGEEWKEKETKSVVLNAESIDGLTEEYRKLLEEHEKAILAAGNLMKYESHTVIKFKPKA